MPLVIGFHGNDRDCSYWVDTWKEYAEKKGFMFFIPLFTHEKFPTRRYQELGVKDNNGNILTAHDRTSALVDSLIFHILKCSGTADDKVTVFGHSAGGQFVHRFMLLNSSPFIKKAIIGNPGWFTFPTKDYNYSYGIKDLDDFTPAQLRRMLRQNVILQLAEGDTIRESFLRKTPEADRQGMNRLERGNRFFEILDSISKAAHYDFNWRRVYVPNVGHDAIAMSRFAAEHLLEDSISIPISENDGKFIKAESNWLHRYNDDIENLIKLSDADNDIVCDVLFLGSSSIRLWPHLKKAMYPLNVKQRGYGGATMRDLMINYRSVMGPYQPKTIVLYCDNDICGWKEGDLEVEEVLALYKAFISMIHHDYPERKIYFLSIKHSLSRITLREKQQQLNSLMAEYANTDPYLEYVDVSSLLINENGDVNDALFMDDHLHLNAKGYQRWNAKLKPLLIKECKK